MKIELEMCPERNVVEIHQKLCKLFQAFKNVTWAVNCNVLVFWVTQHI